MGSQLSDLITEFPKWQSRRMAPLTRRRFVSLTAMALASTARDQAAGATNETRTKTRDGANSKDFVRKTVTQAFDAEMEAFMSARGVPGGALAVVRNRRLVYARGYGLADREKGIAAMPSTLFRIASVSKPITAVAILKLVEAGRLDLDAPAWKILGSEALADASKVGAVDPRQERIAVRHLLHHTGGWDRDKSFDPMFRSRMIADKLGTQRPASPDSIIHYMAGQPLDFDPGARYAYSNFGYCLLGRIIEKLSGESYEQFVRKRILAPLDIKNMRIGASLDGNQAPGESRYYLAEQKEVKSVFPGSLENVPWPYGGFCLESMDSHGGWIASVVDLARFAAALDDPEHCRILKAPVLRGMYEPPPPPAWRVPDGTLAAAYYGFGWMVRPVGQSGKANYWHAGSLPGTSSLLVRRWDGLSWAVIFNQRSENPKLPDNAIDQALHRAADAVGRWPRGEAL